MFARLMTFGVVLAVAAPGMAADNAKPVTFSKDVAPIFQAKCQECHQRTRSRHVAHHLSASAPWAVSIRARGIASKCRRSLERSVGVQKFRTTCRSPTSRWRQSSPGSTAGRRKASEGSAASETARHRQRLNRCSRQYGCRSRHHVRVRCPRGTRTCEYGDVGHPHHGAPLGRMVEIRPTI